jgi:hypothetical protein
MGLSLALWSLALNARGHTPALDYGGWWASATPLVAAALAVAVHRVRLMREA